MANESIFTAPEHGALFLQIRYGEAPVFLGCHDLEDIVDDSGSKSITQCYDQNSGKYKTLATITTPPDLQTVNITTYLGKVAEYLEDFKNLGCPGKLFVNMFTCGKPETTNYDRVFVLDQFEVNKATYMGLVRRNEGVASEAQFESTYSPTVGMIFKVQVVQTTTAETQDANSVVMYSLPCEGTCPEGGKYGFAVTDSDVVSSPTVSANVLHSEDSGASWTATAADPFAGGENITGLVVVPSGTSVRVIVARGTTDGAAPAEVALSDDEGTTWVTVSITGAANGTYAPYGNSLFATDKNHIWLGLSDGSMWFSDNGGVTWTEQTSPTTEDVFAIHFYNNSRGVAGGTNNALMSTSDGGDTWSLLTAPAARAADTIQTVLQLSADVIMIGYNTGYIYLSTDRGVTWTAQTFTGSGTGSVQDLFDASGVIYMVHNAAGGMGYVFRTFDGGADWERYDTPTNSGVNSIFATETNKAILVGDTHSAITFTAKVLPK